MKKLHKNIRVSPGITFIKTTNQPELQNNQRRNICAVHSCYIGRTGRQELSMVISHNYKLEWIGSSFLNIHTALLGREAVIQVKLHSQKWQAHLQHNTTKNQNKPEQFKIPRSTGQAPEMNANTSLEKPESFYSSQNTLFWGQLLLPLSLARHKASFTPLAVVCKGAPKGPRHNPQPGCWLAQHLSDALLYSLLLKRFQTYSFGRFHLGRGSPSHDWMQSALHTTALNPLRAPDGTPAKVHSVIKKWTIIKAVRVEQTTAFMILVKLLGDRTTNALKWKQIRLYCSICRHKTHHFMSPRSGVRHAVSTLPNTILMQFICLNIELEERKKIFLINAFQ